MKKNFKRNELWLDIDTGRWISVSSKPAWFIQKVSGQLLHDFMASLSMMTSMFSQEHRNLLVHWMSVTPIWQVTHIPRVRKPVRPFLKSPSVLTGTGNANGWKASDRSGRARFEGKGTDAKCRTHGWETRVPRGRVITAGTDADITVVYLRRAQAMGSPSVLQVFILLPPEARQHLQLRFAHLAGLIVSPVIFLTQKDREIRVYCSFNFMSYQ